MMTETAGGGLTPPDQELDALAAHRIVRCITEGLDDGAGAGQTIAILQGGRLRAIVFRRDGRTVSVVRADGGA